MKAIEILSKQIENEKWYVKICGDNEDFKKTSKADDLYDLGRLYCKIKHYEKSYKFVFKMCRIIS